MEPGPVPGSRDVHVVDTELFGLPEVMSAYVVDADRPAVVDVGAATAVEPILDALDALGIDPGAVEYLIPTHVHLDHAGAAGALARECENATVLVHERGREFLVEEERLDHLVASAHRALGDMADQYGDPGLVPAERCHPITDGDTVDLGSRRLDVIDAPGHAPHQVALYDAMDGALFAGDAAGMSLGGAIYPTTPPPNFDLAASLDTIDRLAALEPDVVCYGHFGARSEAVGALERYREVLPEWVADIEAAVEQHGTAHDELVESLAPRWPMPTLDRDVAGVVRWLEES